MDHVVPRRVIQNILRLLCRCYRSKVNFRTLYRRKVDRWILFRNTGPSFQRVAEGEGSTRSFLRRSGYEKFFRDLSLSP